MYKLTIGADPEFFVFDENEQLVTADQIFPGKHTPHKFEDGQSVFFDGVQGEFNINPATSAADLHANIMAAINSIKAEFKVDNIKFVPTVEVNPEELKDRDPECNRFGCQPDLDIYSLSQRLNRIDASKHPYRYAAGHVHIGNLPEEITNNQDKTILFIKALDIFVGIPSVLWDHSEETKIRRSFHYGKAGTFRITSYGFEYRVLSNKWVGNEQLTKIVVDGIYKAVEATLDGTVEKILDEFGEEEIRHIIDNVDEERAKAFLNEVGYVVPY